jgi:hypothetical protein
MNSAAGATHRSTCCVCQALEPLQSGDLSGREWAWSGESGMESMLGRSGTSKVQGSRSGVILKVSQLCMARDDEVKSNPRR